MLSNVSLAAPQPRVSTTQVAHRRTHIEATTRLVQVERRWHLFYETAWTGARNAPAGGIPDLDQGALFGHSRHKLQPHPAHASSVPDDLMLQRASKRATAWQQRTPPSRSTHDSLKKPTNNTDSHLAVGREIDTGHLSVRGG
eukprot:1135208-Rhodomonas_salina.2